MPQAICEGFPQGRLRASRGRRKGELAVKGSGGVEPTLYHWKRRALINTGRAEGIRLRGGRAGPGAEEPLSSTLDADPDLTLKSLVRKTG